MRCSRFVISLVLLLAAGPCAQADTIPEQPTCQSRYDQRIHRYRRYWANLIPTQFVLQNAGNMGALSAGIGWDYGRRRQWETHLLWGYIPPHHSSRGKLTTTLKQNYLPWSLTLSNGWSLEPLSASLYLNTVYGHEFWRSQPGRYPDGYYDFMSTKFRLNVALGQQLTWQVPQSRRKYHRSVTLFYELSTCDLYLRAKFLEHSVSLSDVIGLSLGIKLQTL